VLALDQAGDDPIVGRGIRVLGVEADLQCEDGRVLDVIGPDDLCFVVLARWPLRAEPDLDAVPVPAEAHLAEIAQGRAAERLGDLFEQRQLHGARAASRRG